MSNVAIMLSEAELEALIDRRVDAKLAKVAPAQVKENLNMAEVCELLGVSRKTIAHYVKSEGLPHVPVGKRENRFIRSKVLAWQEARQRENR